MRICVVLAELGGGYGLMEMLLGRGRLEDLIDRKGGNRAVDSSTWVLTPLIGLMRRNLWCDETTLYLAVNIQVHNRKYSRICELRPNTEMGEMVDEGLAEWV